jgi:VanZ family protein
MSPPQQPDWPARWRRWYLRIFPAYWITLFLVLHFPRLRIPEQMPSDDRLYHMLAFALLAFLLWRFVEALRDAPPPPRFYAVALPALCAYAALDEYLQSFVGRSTETGDWLANTAGVFLGLTPLEILRRRRLAQPARAPH